MVQCRPPESVMCWGGNWEKIGLHVGNMKINEQNNNIGVILPVYFYITICH